MNATIRAYVAVARGLQMPGGITIEEILQIAERYQVDKDKLAEAVCSADSFKAAEILGVDADQLNEALHFYVLPEPDEFAVEPATVQTGQSEIVVVPHDFPVIASCDLCCWSREYRCSKVEWEENLGKLLQTYVRAHTAENPECNADPEHLRVQIHPEKIVPLATALPIERGFIEALQAIMQQWPVDPEQRQEGFRRVNELGGVNAVKSVLTESGQTEAFMSLSASGRLDLTFEALALCPAWKDLFSDEEKALARERLSEGRTAWESWKDRPAETWRDTCVFWIDGRPVGGTRSGYYSATPLRVCDMFARISDLFEKTGQLRASLSERRHYHRCNNCSALSSLKEILARVDKKEFNRLRKLLETMPVMLNGPLCWETITVLAFIDRTCDVDPEDWVAARQGGMDEPFSDFVRSLDTFGFFGLLLAKRFGKMFGPPALACHDQLFLPSDLGLSSERGLLDTTLSPDDWNRFRDTEDAEMYGRRSGVDVFSDPQANFRDLMYLALEAINFQIQNLWKGRNPEYLIRADLHAEFDRRIDRKDPDRLAKASLRRTLGDDICNSLCLEAYMAAMDAERLCLEASPLTTGDLIVTALVRAFEHQLDYLLIEPLRKLMEKTPNLRLWEAKLVAGEKLTLGEKAQFIYHPASELETLCMELCVDLKRLSKGFGKVLKHRNKVSHLQHHYSLPEGQELKNRWLGMIDGDGGIFALLAKPKA